jgi:hypothetical protein
MFSVLDDPEHWLCQEREARHAAEAATQGKVREIMTRLADEYRKRAEASEKRRLADEICFNQASPQNN